MKSVPITVDLESLLSKFTIDREHRWGHQIRMVNFPADQGNYCGKFLVLTNDESGSAHYHKVKKETFIVLSGMVEIYSEYGGATFCAGDQVTFEPYQWHRVEASAFPAVILEVSTHDDDDDTYPWENGGNLT